MAYKTLKQRAEEARTAIAKAHEELTKVQAECSHPVEVLEKVHRGSQGNWDPYQDKYWTEFTCGVCGKYWTEDGSL